MNYRIFRIYSDLTRRIVDFEQRPRKPPIDMDAWRNISNAPKMVDLASNFAVYLIISLICLAVAYAGAWVAETGSIEAFSGMFLGCLLVSYAALWALILLLLALGLLLLRDYRMGIKAPRVIDVNYTIKQLREDRIWAESQLDGLHYQLKVMREELETLRPTPTPEEDDSNVH